MLRSFFLTLFFLPLTLWIFKTTDLDLIVQSHLYNFALQQWLIDRDDQLLKFIFYDGVKIAYVLFLLFLFTLLAFFRNTKRLIKHKQGLYIVLLSCLLIPFAIGALKAVTHIPCPKQITYYHGTYPYLKVFQHFPADSQVYKKAECFPAGHASGGFALLSIFFLFKDRKRRIIALTSALTFGWVIGTYKMMIGDHFLSHTLVSMELGWLLVLLIQHTLAYWHNKIDRRPVSTFSLISSAIKCE
jgi:membrane-associated PAP2 superfamily phosphatase